MYLSPLAHPPVAKDDVHSKAGVLLLLIHCLMYLQLLVGIMCLFFVMINALLSVLSSLQSLDEIERAGCIALIVFLMSCYC